MKFKTVSVHIVTYNSADDIAECLSAVLNQDYPVKKIVVVDNASTDGSVEKVRAFYHELTQGSARMLIDPLHSVDAAGISSHTAASANYVGSLESPSIPTLVLLENEHNTGFAPRTIRRLPGLRPIMCWC